MRITPRYYALTLSPEEQLLVDDAVIARGISLRDAIAWHDPRLDLYDLAAGAAPLFDIAWATLGRGPSTIVAVEGLEPFAWRDFDGRAALERAMPRLPGFLPGPGMFRFFRRDEFGPPYLWASHEAPGLQVVGLLDEDLWAAWYRAFQMETAAWPRRET